eukprot:ANDGO_04106.mRNA.1 hypothetical protein
MPFKEFPAYQSVVCEVLSPCEFRSQFVEVFEQSEERTHFSIDSMGRNRNRSGSSTEESKQHNADTLSDHASSDDGGHKIKSEAFVLYETAWSPFSAKVRGALNYLGLPFKPVEIQSVSEHVLRYLESRATNPAVESSVEKKRSEAPASASASASAPALKHEAHVEHHLRTPVLVDHNMQGVVIESSDAILTHLNAFYTDEAKQLVPNDGIKKMLRALDEDIGLAGRKLAYTRISLMDASVFADLYYAHKRTYLRLPWIRFLTGMLIAMSTVSEYDLHLNEQNHVLENLEAVLWNEWLPRVHRAQENSEWLAGPVFTMVDIAFSEFLRPLLIVPRIANDVRFKELLDFQKRAIAHGNLDPIENCLWCQLASQLKHRSLWHFPIDVAIISTRKAEQLVRSIASSSNYVGRIRNRIPLFQTASAIQDAQASSGASEDLIIKLHNSRSKGLVSGTIDLAAGLVSSGYNFWVGIRPQLWSTG